MIIDAKNLILGRLATVVAKKSLLGEKIKVVNCENAIVIGKKESVLTKYKQKADRGVPAKGPFIPKTPDKFVRRVIRGMLPYKKQKGKLAFKNVKCYIGVPGEFKDKEYTAVKEAGIEKSKNLRYITVKEICKYLGGKV